MGESSASSSPDSPEEESVPREALWVWLNLELETDVVADEGSGYKQSREPFLQPVQSQNVSHDQASDSKWIRTLADGACLITLTTRELQWMESLPRDAGGLTFTLLLRHV